MGSDDSDRGRRTPRRPAGRTTVAFERSVIHMGSSDIENLLAPESVAIVGASPDSWYASNLVDNLLAYGYDGEVYLVNPNRERAWDRECYDSLSSVPEVVDLAVVCVPRTLVVDVVEEAGEMGVPAALVITAGFAEADDEGAALERDLATAIGRHDVVVCGPNCIGVANPGEETVLTSTCSRKPSPGSIGLVSQSGALAFTTFYERGADEDLGFSHVVSTGNEVDLTLADYVSYLADDPTVEVICTYLEGVADPGKLRRAAETAVAGGTPVLTVKVGRSESAERAAYSHTGSLTGNDDAWNGLFDQAGIERVPDVPDLLERAKAHAAFDPPETSRVCIASTSGGLASLLAGMASERGVELPALSAETQSSLKSVEDLLAFDDLNNPIDIRGAGADHLPRVAETLFADENFDAYVFAVGLSAVDDRAERIADDLVSLAEATEDPVFVLWTGRRASADDGPLPYERVRRELPLYADPGRCMDALQSVIDFRKRRDRLAGRTLDDRSVAVESTGAIRETGVLTWASATELLASAGIETIPTRTASSAEKTATMATELGYPVVVKVDSPAIPHRAEADAVRLGVTDPDEAAKAYDAVVGNAREYAGEAVTDRVVVQHQASEGIEAIVGVSRDDVFGPLVTVGIGGSMAELVDDVAVRVPPFDADEARRAIQSTRLGEVIVESAGTDRLDELASLVAAVGDLATAVDSIAELDFNPVVVGDDDVGIVDVLVRVE